MMGGICGLLGRTQEVLGDGANGWVMVASPRGGGGGVGMVPVGRGGAWFGGVGVE